MVKKETEQTVPKTCKTCMTELEPWQSRCPNCPTNDYVCPWCGDDCSGECHCTSQLRKYW